MRTLAAACLVTMSALTAGQTIAGLPVCPAANPQCYRNGAADYGEAACTDSSLTTQCCCETGFKGGSTTNACLDSELILCYAKAQQKKQTDEVFERIEQLEKDGSQLWIIYCGALVFFMQCGFAMLEAGAVRTQNTLNIIFKNLMDACIGAISFYCLGYGFAYGTDKGHFIGANNFFLMHFDDDETQQHSWFFQFAFAATAATITSGSVCERTKLVAYFVYALFLTTWIYPVVVHWVWSNDGWLSAFAPVDIKLGRIGFIDYAGSGVVHTVGGFAGLMGAIFVGPRLGRFNEAGEVQKLQGQSGASRTALSALGVLILWFGWYGFNCGSTLAFDGINAGKVATTTTLSAASASLTATFFTKFWSGAYELDQCLNAVLAGLVSITAGCSVVDEWAAVVIGIAGAMIFLFFSNVLLWLRIDDPLNAFPVHGACGVWGCLAVGIFGRWRNIARAYSFEDGNMPNTEISSGMQFAVQLAGVLSIIVWTVLNCSFVFFFINLTIGMRVDEASETQGIDTQEHGADAYQRSFMGVSQSAQGHGEQDISKEEEMAEAKRQG
eukprot:TRINITY_DN847_c0_g1_i6.p1 TRINITY_DN847_c0_g1~~TRINITY_DN847_c0_g1_i6.p1  ORF type:complete len:584 (+),score=238.64 TRINITY_DN847_c0_g1_i6:93-1754(+)